MTTHRQHPGPKSYEEQLCRKLAWVAKEHGLTTDQAQAMLQAAAEGLQAIAAERKRRQDAEAQARYRRKRKRA